MAERCRDIIQDKPEDIRFALPNPLRPSYLRWMCKEIVDHAEKWATNKSHRWLGFVQAGMIANYMLNLDAAKVMFDKLKEQYGADQDLLDHLDPSTTFRMETGGEGCLCRRRVGAMYRKGESCTKMRRASISIS